mgnify:CR=1 FL=1
MSKLKRVDKLFMENPKMYAGWLDLNINNDIVIPVSYLNSRFFYDLISIALILDCYGSVETDNLSLYIDCEGTEANIDFVISDRKTMKIIVSKEYYNFKTDEEGVDIFRYEIDRLSLINNIFNLVENNIDIYNTDFCCGDIGDYITKDYVKSLRLKLVLF